MAKGKKRLRDEVVVAVIVMAIILFAIIVGWWEKHAVIGWTVLGVVVIAFGFSLYRFERFRTWVFKKSKSTGEKIVFTDEAPGREQIPQNLYSKIMNHANNRCQNPDCRFQGKPQIHHINQNNRDNRMWNLIALCPNCHAEAHHGKYSFSQLRNWNKMKLAPKTVRA
jgi:hypothetical protein